MIYELNKKNQNLFFLFTCVKDGNDYVDKLFDSLINQTTYNFVHYIYEDGSSVPLGNKFTTYKKRVEQLENPYEVIYEYNPVNIGLNKSTQHCISKCSCPYFIWIDCDNWVDKDFFKQLEILARKKPKGDILRTKLSLTTANIKHNVVFNNWKKELQLFLRSNYYYSFFAVKYDFYKSINPELVFMDERTFFNDDQVLLLSLISKPTIKYTDKAIGYFLERNDQESAGSIAIEAGKEAQLSLLKKISNEKYNFIKTYYELKNETRLIDSLVEKSPKEAFIKYKEVVKKCRTAKIPYSVLHYKNKARMYLSIAFHILKK